MSSNYLIKLLFSFLLLTSILYANKPKQAEKLYKEDMLMLMAVDYENRDKYLESGQIYEELFDDLQEFQYLKKAIENYAKAQYYYQISDLTYNNMDKFPKYEEFLQQQYILANVILDKYDLALKVSKDLLQKYPNYKNYLIVGDLYFVIGSYKHAKKYYENAFNISESVKSLIAMTDISYNYLDEKNEALNKLLQYKQKHGCDIDVCSRLIRYQQTLENKSEVLVLLEEIYNKYKDTFTKEKLKKVEDYIAQTYQSIDINKAISFLEKTGGDFDKLLTLYGATKQYKKALELVESKYNETKEVELLGRIAILEFELAESKITVIPKVLEKFALALTNKENANYENYYGYILIDYDLDPEKGLKYVRKALAKQPNNLAFMDSVAWGLYKLGQCTEAAKYIQKIVDVAGLENEEIRYHYEQIRKCINDTR